jgi:uncharacterized protein
VHARAAELVATLRLEPHPEGGYYRQIFQSAAIVQPADGRGIRTALTTIYFLLVAGDVSRWHSVASDEVWHFYEGDPLELFVGDALLGRVERHVLGPLSERAQPVHVAPAGMWQAARSRGQYTQVGCSVGPGFEFADFRMLRDASPEIAAEARGRPEQAAFV